MTGDPAVERYFTQRFVNLYGAPDVVDPASFVEEYQRALAGTASEILGVASDQIVRQHKFRNWPTVGECVEAVNNVAERLQRERSQKQPATYQSKTAATEESRARVDALVKQAINKLATASAQPEKRAKWVATDRDAWSRRMNESVTARWLSLPREYRESFGAAAEFEHSERDRWPTGDE